jgi:membrane associated rhomboid family serine protease
MTRRFEHGPLDFQAMSPVIKGLIIANIAAFVLMNLVGERQFAAFFGLVPYRVVHHFFFWQPLTYLFLHGGFLHLLFNVFALWMFGMPVEGQWGPREFLKFFFVCGIGSGLLNVLVDPHSASPIIGASGAVYGLLVAFAMLFPDAVIYLYFFIPMRAKHMAMLFVFLEFMAATSSSGSKIARFVHLGGAVIAYVYIRYWNSARIYGRAFVNELGERLRGETRRRPKGRYTASPERTEREQEEGVRTTSDDMAEVDRILDKISDHGEMSLTDEERETLLRHAKKKPEGHA